MLTQGDPEHYLRQLLAVIHGDGGHYVEENGFHKATEDALGRIHFLRGKIDRAMYELSRDDPLPASTLDEPFF